ncbi:MAG: serine/threonine-protein kinase [Polyangiales bacterium]
MSVAPARSSLQPSEHRLGRYTLRYRIAQGGMATVYLARLDISGGFAKWVAVKTIHPHIATTPRFVSMFLDEARLAARMNHPNLCTVFDFGESDGTWYIAMEYLHGETLGVLARDGWTRQTPPPYGLVAKVLADAARGLHAAHELKLETGESAGVVHRDVSPENIFVTYDGTAKVVDFGVARSRVQSYDRTATGELKGKVAYMSPEQIRESSIDRRTDIWALGVVLWEVTVGRRLFRRKSDAATVLAVLQDAVPDPRRFRPDYPEGLALVVRRALDRDPSKRFQSALEFARALEQWAAAAGVSTDADEVSSYMRDLFAEQIAVREDLLRAAAVDAPLEAVDALWQTHSGDEIGRAALALRSEPPDDEPTLHVERPSREPRDSVIPLTRSASRPPAEPDTLRDRLESDRPHTAATRTAPHRAVARSVPPPRRPASLALLAALAVAGLAVAAAILWFDRPRIPNTTSRIPLRVRPVPVAPAVPVVVPSGAGQQSPSSEPDLPVVRVPANLAPLDPPDASAERPSTPRSAPTRAARPAPAPAPERVDATPRGYLTFTATPTAEVYEGQRLIGTTPITDRAFSPGSHTFRFVAVEGGAEREMSVDVSPGGSAVVQVRLRPE